MNPNAAPREFATQLREIIDPKMKSQDILVGPVDGVLRLKDHTSGMTFNVTGVSDEAVAIRVDRIQHLKALAPSRELQLNLACDYLLVEGSAGRTQQLAVLLELKETIGYDSRPREQLRRSLPILRYLRSVCEVHFMQQVALQEKYVLVGKAFHSSFDKQSIRFERGRPHNEDYRGIRIKVMVGVGETLAALAS